MGGVRNAVLLAALVATVSAIPSFLDTQECTKCSPCLKDNDYKVPVSDVCSYCRCSPDQTPTLEKCPVGTEYDATVDDCVPSTRCGHTKCEAHCEACYHGIKFNSTESCGYCECKIDGTMEYHDCPPGTGWENYECVPKDECCDNNGCSKYTCPPCYHGMGIRFPDPYDSCGFCCCEPEDGNSTHEIPVPKKCPDDMVFDPDQNNCVYEPNRVCHKKDCFTTTHTLPTLPTITTPKTCPPPPPNCDVTCPPEHYGERWLMENPVDPCSFCCCEPDGTGKEIPHFKTCWEHDQYFDPVDKVCKRNGTICPRPPPDHHDCRDPSDKDGCNLMVSLCAYDADGLLPNPYDDRSFCQCDNGNIHWMPCPPGTGRFIDSVGTCV